MITASSAPRPYRIATRELSATAPPQPPCLWGDETNEGIEAMPLASGVPMLIKAITNSTYGHHGEMAFPEVTLVPFGGGPCCHSLRSFSVHNKGFSHKRDWGGKWNDALWVLVWPRACHLEGKAESCEAVNVICFKFVVTSAPVSFM